MNPFISLTVVFKEKIIESEVGKTLERWRNKKNLICRRSWLQFFL